MGSYLVPDKDSMFVNRYFSALRAGNNLSLLKEGSSDVDAITGQNLFLFYEPFFCEINGAILNKYDDTIENAFNDAMKSYLAGKIKSRDEVISTFKAKVKQNLNDIIVE